MPKDDLHPVAMAAGALDADTAVAGLPVRGAIYPKLDKSRDYGVFRVSGAGLGNCLYAYFHAYILSLRSGVPLIHPAWPSLKLGPLLRGERSKRFYIGLFRAPPGEVSGGGKIARLLGGLPKARRVAAPNNQCEAEIGRTLTIVRCTKFGFAHFHAWRQPIRDRMIAMLAQPPAAPIGWGSGDYAAVHVRLGDFAVAKPGQLAGGKLNNLRIPLEWYEAAIGRVRAIFPHLPVHVFSDGSETDLARLLALPGVSLRREPDDVGDLLAMAQARLLIGSNSTFSHWAAFLGDMPTIWLRTEREQERLGDVGTPALYVGDDAEGISESALCAT